MNPALFSALLLGIVAGLRSMTPLATVSLAARAGRLTLANSFLSFLRYPLSAWIFCLLALGEFIADKLPSIPSRKQAVPFAARVVSGAIAGGAAGLSVGMLALGTVLGVVGAIAGTLGGSAFRAGLANAFRKDLPAALIEDAIAIILAVVAYSLMPAHPLAAAGQ